MGLDAGSFGVVYRGRYRHVGVAIKEVPITTDKSHDAFHAEVGVLGLLVHPHITTFYVGLTWSKTGTMVLELFACSVHDALYTAACAVKLDADDKIAVIKAVVSAMPHLHGHRPKVIHRDLKPENIMLTEYRVPKLIDFGLAQTKTSSRSTAVGAGGTRPYMAPELFSGTETGTHRVDQ